MEHNWQPMSELLKKFKQSKTATAEQRAEEEKIRTIAVGQMIKFRSPVSPYYGDVAEIEGIKGDHLYVRLAEPAATGFDLVTVWIGWVSLVDQNDTMDRLLVQRYNRLRQR